MHFEAKQTERWHGRYFQVYLSAEIDNRNDRLVRVCLLSPLRRMICVPALPHSVVKWLKRDGERTGLRGVHFLTHWASPLTGCIQNRKTNQKRQLATIVQKDSTERSPCVSVSFSRYDRTETVLSGSFPLCPLKHAASVFTEVRIDRDGAVAELDRQLARRD